MCTWLTVNLLCRSGYAYSNHCIHEASLFHAEKLKDRTIIWASYCTQALQLSSLCSIPHIRAPFMYNPPPSHPLHFQPKFLHRYFDLAHMPTKPYWTPILSSSKSQWWSGKARTKPASTEQLRILLLITSIFASGVNAEQLSSWKNLLSTQWPTSVGQSWPRVCEIECQIPHISPPMLLTSAKVAEWWAYIQCNHCGLYSQWLYVRL